MGGLLAPLGEMWAKSLEKEGGIGSKLMSLVGNKEWELDISPEGKAIKAQLGEYQRLRSAALGGTKVQMLQETHCHCIRQRLLIYMLML
jgi:hypothetical protein